MHIELNKLILGAVIAVVIIASVGLLASFYYPGFHGSQVSSTSSPTYSTTCEVLAEGSLFVTVLNGTSGKPINNVAIQVTEFPPSPCTNTFSTIDLGVKSTNSSGMITICCDTGGYDLSATYLGSSYSASALIEPEKATCVTLYLPSGQVKSNYSQTFGFAC